MIQAAARLLGRYRQINWALADQAMVSGVNFLTGILLARYLGLEGFGQFTLAWMAVLFVNALQHATIIAPMMSIAPKQPEADLPTYYGAVIAQQAVFSLCAFAVLFATIEASPLVFPDWGLGGLGLPLACAAVAFQCQDFLRRYLFTRSRGAQACITDAVRYLGQITVLFWLFRTFPEQRHIETVLWVIAVTGAAALAFGPFLVEKVAWAPHAIATTAARHWRFSKWMVGSSVMNWITGNLFILTAGALLGATAVGALKAAQTLMGVTHILFQGLENVVPVRAAWHFEHGGSVALTRYLRKIGVVFGLVTLGIAAVASAAPDFWLGIAFGAEYLGYGYLVQWYAVIYLAAFIGLPLRVAQRTIESTRTIFWGSLWMTIFSVLFAYPLIKSFGLSGVVIGNLLIYVILIATFLHGLRKRLV